MSTRRDEAAARGGGAVPFAARGGPPTGNLPPVEATPVTGSFRLGAEPLDRTDGASRAAVPPILCYHKVDTRYELGVTRVSPRRFARQIERLAADGWRTLTLDELIACAQGRRAVGAREIAITFDDAYRALRDRAFPVLRAHGFGAVCAVVTDYAGKLNRWDVAYGGRRFAHLAWRDLRRWRAHGIEVVSHTATHPRLTWASERAAAAEMRRSRDAIERELGEAARAVSYPFGAARARERTLAREAGYEAGFVLASRWRGDALAIPRVPVYPWAPPRPAVGALRHVEWLGAWAANRCAVGTTLWQRARGSR